MGLFDYSKYVMDQKLLSIRDTYIIRDPAGNELGKIQKKFFSIGPKYTFYDHGGTEVGRIEGKLLALRPTYSILDQKGNLIATLKKKLLTFFGSKYWFESRKGQEIMRAKGNFLAHEYQITDSAGNTLAHISKKWLSIRDSYGIDIIGKADRYLILAAAVCIDAVEHEERKRSRQQ